MEALRVVFHGPAVHRYFFVVDVIVFTGLVFLSLDSVSTFCRFEFEDERCTVRKSEREDLLIVEATEILAETSEDVLVSGEEDLGAWLQMLHGRHDLLTPVRLHACADELETFTGRH